MGGREYSRRQEPGPTATLLFRLPQDDLEHPLDVIAGADTD